MNENPCGSPGFSAPVDLMRELVHLLMSAQLSHLRMGFLCSSLTCAAKGNGKEAAQVCTTVAGRSWVTVTPPAWRTLLNGFSSSVRSFLSKLAKSQCGLAR